MDAKTLGNQPVSAYEHIFPEPDARKQRTGITLRQHFAGMAMQGLIASHGSHHRSVQECAPIAVRAADALLDELAKEQK